MITMDMKLGSLAVEVDGRYWQLVATGPYNVWRLAIAASRNNPVSVAIPIGLPGEGQLCGVKINHEWIEFDTVLGNGNAHLDVEGGTLAFDSKLHYHDHVEIMLRPSTSSPMSLVGTDPAPDRAPAVTRPAGHRGKFKVVTEIEIEIDGPRCGGGCLYKVAAGVMVAKCQAFLDLRTLRRDGDGHLLRCKECLTHG